MFSIEYDLSAVPGLDHSLVEVYAQDLVGLMEVWLSELLFLHDARRIAFRDFKVQAITADPGDCRLEANVSGTTIADWFTPIGPQIKAVTLHGMEITPAGEGASVVVYLDV